MWYKPKSASYQHLKFSRQDALCHIWNSRSGRAVTVRLSSVSRKRRCACVGVSLSDMSRREEVLLESTTVSSVSLTLRERLLSLHQISDSSSLVKSWSAAASSADLMTWSLWCVMMGGRGGAQGTATSLRTEGDDVTRIYPLGTTNVCSKFYCNLILRYFSMVNWSTDKYL